MIVRVKVTSYLDSYLFKSLVCFSTISWSCRFVKFLYPSTTEFYLRSDGSELGKKKKEKLSIPRPIKIKHSERLYSGERSSQSKYCALGSSLVIRWEKGKRCMMTMSLATAASTYTFKFPHCFGSQLNFFTVLCGTVQMLYRAIERTALAAVTFFRHR